MKLFLTSSPSGALDQPNEDRLLDNTNGFVDQLKTLWKKEMKGLMIAADPENFSGNDEMTAFFTDAFNHSGLPILGFKLWDYRSQEINREILMQSDFIMLAGGHLPTQNTFFHQINLSSLLHGYQGVVIGISAGTMNCANEVYVMPEMPYEAIDPNFKRFSNGLGLTEINVLPHYQLVRDMVVDGLRLYEEIIYPDSHGKRFFALPDGSYIVCDEKGKRLYGEGYLVQNGIIRQISFLNHWIEL